jgi:hypothetical protein
MNIEDAAILLGIILIPTIIICLTAFYMMRMYVDLLNDSMYRKAKARTTAPVISSGGGEDIRTRLRLQAMERFVLYLERIEPYRMVMRLNRAGMNARMLQNEMIKTIREEFEHNLSQQIYISENSWKLIKNANRETKKLVNLSAEQISEEASSYELGKKLFEVASQVERLPSQIALDYLRKEVGELMN